MNPHTYPAELSGQPNDFTDVKCAEQHLAPSASHCYYPKASLQESQTLPESSVEQMRNKLVDTYC